MTNHDNDMFVTKTGRFQKLNHTNWHAWEENMTAHLRLIDAYDMCFTDGAARPPEPRANAAAHIYNRQMGLCDKWDKALREPRSSLWNGVFDEAHQYINSEDEPSVIWNALSITYDTTNSAVGRQTIWKKFMASRPTPGEPIGNWFSKLLGWRHQLSASPEAIPDMSVRMHIFDHLPESYRNAIEREQMRPNDTIIRTMENLKAFELANALRTNPAAEALNTQAQQPAGRGRGSTPRGRGQTNARGGNKDARGSRGRGTTYPPPDHNKYCAKHGKTGHSTAECTLPDYRPSNSNSAAARPTLSKRKSAFCLHCGEDGHTADRCPVKARLAKKLKQTSGAAYATTFAKGEEDGDPGH